MEFLRRPILGQLGYMGLDGHPRIVPMWYDIEGDEIWISSPPSSYKNRSLKADPRAAFSAFTSEYPYLQVTITGEVTIEKLPAQKRVAYAKRLVRRYLDALQSKAYMVRYLQTHPGDGELIRLQPKRAQLRKLGEG